MSLHLFDLKSRTISSPASNNSPTREESGDSESPSCSSGFCKLEEAVKRMKMELARTKKEIKELSTQLQLAESERAVNEEKYEEKVKELHKAKCKINELQKLCENLEGETVSSKARLEEMSDRLDRSNKRRESFEKECCRLKSEKSQLLEELALLEDEVGALKTRNQTEEQLLTELEQQRRTNMKLRNGLAAVKNCEHGVLARVSIEEEGPERMIFGQLDFDGINLHQELAMVGSPFAPTASQSGQLPSAENILEGEAAVPVDAANQTERVPIAESFTQSEVLTLITVSTQTQKTNVSNASLQTVRMPSQPFASVSTQTTASNQGNDSLLSSGMASSLQTYRSPYQPMENTICFRQPVVSGPVDSPNDLKTRWIWIVAFLIVIFAYIASGRQISITPLVNLFRSGLKFRYRGVPPV